MTEPTSLPPIPPEQQTPEVRRLIVAYERLVQANAAHRTRIQRLEAELTRLRPAAAPALAPTARPVVAQAIRPELPKDASAAARQAVDAARHHAAQTAAAPTTARPARIHEPREPMLVLLREALSHGLRAFVPAREPERIAGEAVQGTYGRVTLENGRAAAAAAAIQPILPWVSGLDEEKRYRRWLLILFLVFFLSALSITFLIPRPPEERGTRDQIPQRLAQLVLEQKQPKPPEPPKPAEEEKKPDEKKPEEPKEEVKPEQKAPESKPSEERVKQAREKASRSGLNALSRQLAAMRSDSMLAGLKGGPSTFGQPLVGAGAQRDIITAPAGSRNVLAERASAGSGGISTEAVALGGEGLGTRQTAAVTSNISTADAGKPKKPGGKAERTSEEIQLVFDRHKGAIYALYNRALRKNPGIKGRVILELEIAPEGNVVSVRIVSSELGDDELEAKLMARVKLIDFGQRAVEVWKNTYHIDFVPS